MIRVVLTSLALVLPVQAMAGTILIYEYLSAPADTVRNYYPTYSEIPANGERYSFELNFQLDGYVTALPDGQHAFSVTPDGTNYGPFASVWANDPLVKFAMDITVSNGSIIEDDGYFLYAGSDDGIYLNESFRWHADTEYTTSMPGTWSLKSTTFFIDDSDMIAHAPIPTSAVLLLGGLVALRAIRRTNREHFR